jgi:hypothetical protein
MDGIESLRARDVTNISSIPHPNKVVSSSFFQSIFETFEERKQKSEIDNDKIQ